MRSSQPAARLKITKQKIPYILLCCSLLASVGVAESLVVPPSLCVPALNAVPDLSYPQLYFFTSCLPQRFLRLDCTAKLPLRSFVSPATLRRRFTSSLNLQIPDLFSARFFSWIGDIGKRFMPSLFKPEDVAAAWKSLPSVVSWFQPRFFMQGSKRETLWETLLEDGRTIAGLTSAQDILADLLLSRSNVPPQQVFQKILLTQPLAMLFLSVFRRSVHG
jgi:hypothetical protein